MNREELAKKTKINHQRIWRLTKASVDAGQNSIKLGDRIFSFEIVAGHYRYDEAFPEVVELLEDESHLAWQMASEEKRDDATMRYRLVRDYRNRATSESWKQFLQRIEHRYAKLKPTKSKLFRWLQQVKESEENGGDVIASLLDSRGKQCNNRSYTSAHKAMMEELILSNPDIRIKKVWEYLQMRFGAESAPSYATVNRMIQKWKNDPRNVMIWEYAKDPSKAKGKLRPAPGRMDEEITHKNQLWELDGTPADVVCSDGVRYTLSAVLDVYSRRAVVVVAPTSSYLTVGRVIKKAIRELGIPEAMKIDNGKEYRSQAFEYTASRLRCEVIVCPPYSGEKKPHVERFFGTLTRDLFEECAGYIGHSVEDRGRIANRATHPRKLQAKREWATKARGGDAFAKKFAIKKENLGVSVDVPMSREELEGFIDRWIEVYNHKVHRGIKSTPVDRWNKCPVVPRKVSDERVLDVLVGMSEKKRVTKKGVSFLGVQYWHDLLYDRVATSVWAMTDDELGYLYLYTLDMKFLCRAENPELLGKSRMDFVAARKHTKKEAKYIAKLEELRRDIPGKIKELISYRYKRDVEGIEPAVDMALEYKSPIVDEIRDAMAEEPMTDEETQSETEVVLLNGRPAFGSWSERFAWDLENDMVDASTLALADKKPQIWQLAKSAYEERKRA